MPVSFRKRMLNLANKVLGPMGIELIRTDRQFQSYIPLQKTLKGAEIAGLPLGEYIDSQFNVSGTTQATVDKMKEFGVFSGDIQRVCEIGPGSGRYLEKVRQIAQPNHYEIYETSRDWRSWLVDTYHVIPMETDGISMSSTPSESIDLVHTHKVLYGNPIITICKYLDEISRVVRKGGYVVFDLLTEGCLTDEYIGKWIASEVDHACSMTGKEFAVNFFVNRGFRYLGGFFVPMKPGITEYFVFKKL